MVNECEEILFRYSWGRVLSGRVCRQAKALKSEDFGQLFSVQAFGSLTYRHDPSEPSNLSAA